MTAAAAQINDLNDLRDYVHETLCNQNELELGVFPFNERILVRSGKPCGILFCLHGPRSVKFTAIWETQQNTILFYGSSGERMKRTQLIHAPQLVTVAE